ncbi:L-lactate dehydrogenase [Bienertia sinuspersici]
MVDNWAFGVNLFVHIKRNFQLSVEVEVEHRGGDGYVEDIAESSESDNTTKDENYKVDPRELDNEEEEGEEVKENGGERKRRKNNINFDVEEIIHDELSVGEVSDSSVQVNDIVQEELNLDVDELLSIRSTNLDLRKSQRRRTGLVSNYLFDTNTTEIEGEVRQPEQTSTRGEGTTQPIESEGTKRDSDDEGSCWPSNECEEIEPVVKKRKKRVHYPSFDEGTTMNNTTILWYSIQQHKDLIYPKNDQKQIHIGCSGCSWELTAGPDMENPSGWQIKSLQANHVNCKRTISNRLITSEWLVIEFMDKILRNPMIKPIDIKDDMYTRYTIYLSLRKCQGAKTKALNAVQSLMERQYGILKPYLLELIKKEGTILPLDIVKSQEEKEKLLEERTQMSQKRMLENTVGRVWITNATIVVVVAMIEEIVEKREEGLKGARIELALNQLPHHLNTFTKEDEGHRQLLSHLTKLKGQTKQAIAHGW